MNEICRYKLADRECGARIVRSREEYTGWEHEHKVEDNGEKVWWLHWATPDEHVYGNQEDQWLECEVCGKKPNENEEHFKYGGHRYEARIGDEEF